MRERKLLIVVLFLAIVGTGLSQNLAENGGFEEFKSIPTKMNDITKCKHWNESEPFSVMLGTVDYYHQNGSNGTGFSNMDGKQLPKSGKAYVGFSPNNRKFSATKKQPEYLEGKFKSPLIKDSTYCFKMYVSLAENANYPAKQLGVWVGYEAMVHIGAKFQGMSVMNLQPQVRWKNPVKLSDTLQWQCLTGNFIARGGEKFFYIGAYYFDDGYGIKAGKTYYYIDDISLRLESEDKCNCEAIKEVVDTTGIVKEENVLKEKGNINLYFHFDKSDLLTEHKEALKVLLRKAKKHPDKKIMLTGHTDSKGSDGYNQTLSEQRCKTIRKYLIAGGLDPARVQLKGYGSSRPVSTNNTDQGRAFNRRVEVFFFN